MRWHGRSGSSGEKLDLNSPRSTWPQRSRTEAVWVSCSPMSAHWTVTLPLGLQIQEHDTPGTVSKSLAHISKSSVDRSMCPLHLVLPPPILVYCCDLAIRKYGQLVLAAVQIRTRQQRSTETHQRHVSIAHRDSGLHFLSEAYRDHCSALGARSCTWVPAGEC